MKSSIPRKALVYIAILTCVALVVIYNSIMMMDWSQVNIFPILVFLILVVLADSFPVTLPRGGSVTVSFAANAASILLFQPFIVILITIARDLFLLLYRKDRIKNLFNISQVSVSTGLAAIVYRLLTPAGTDFSFNNLPAFIASMLVIFILNPTFVTLILALTQNENPVAIWLINLKWCTPTFISMAPLGALIAVIYINIGFWGLVLFLLPLILARHSFQSYMQMRQTFLDTIKSLSVAIDAKDPYTKGHSSRVANYVVSLAREMRIPEDKVEMLQYIALIHDVGKVSIPEDILKKDRLLSDEEFGIMRTHCEAGAEVLQSIKFFAPASEVIRHHHERWDGLGYPDHIKGEEIPISARILAVADAFDAMTSDRPYRKALSPELALKELEEGAGTQFDPKVVEAFTRIYPLLDFNIQDETNRDDMISDGELFRQELYH
ncbi:MAG: HD-GYP domain-containing protein [Bacillota bacterium]|nr:HD-GYP domain-containing protein [Bacillota bacterium]MDW7729999.1 HD-GYP domain-containing protein [Bacillota bacterium]